MSSAISRQLILNSSTTCLLLDAPALILLLILRYTQNIILVANQARNNNGQLGR
jgi:hypothetical protein